MTIQLGDITLTRLQAVEVEEPRNLVELRPPGASGSTFQDLGRSALRLWLTGVFLGEQSLRDIEVLRAAHADATPLSFSADIVVGTEITDVVLEHFEVHQVPGHDFRYEYRLRVSEWVAPPASPAADLAAVDDEVAGDADQWAMQGEQLAAGLTDPAAMAEALQSDPSLLARIDIGELAQAVLGSLGGLDASDFANLLGAVSNIDPQTALALIEALGEADSLGDLFEILTGEGINLLEELTGIDLSEASSLVQAFLGGIDFVDRAGDVVSSAQALLDSLLAFNPSAALEQLEQGAGA
ncbi:MAG: hypothetical protein K0V04_31870 [Deltaproteobacteria bacterium]|nr:hypothetical protein [Deltaproteobacteria bacterium]